MTFSFLKFSLWSWSLVFDQSISFQLFFALLMSLFRYPKMVDKQSSHLTFITVRESQNARNSSVEENTSISSNYQLFSNLNYVCQVWTDVKNWEMML